MLKLKTVGLPRRTQAERSAATRTRILEAAIASLYRHGYGATTTVMVAATAKVSRGAMLHHFPSKADLMLATLAEVMQRSAANFQAAASRIDDAWERYAALPDLRLESALEPAGVAFMEIMVGARSDEAVSERLDEFRVRLAPRPAQRMADWARASGVEVTDRDQAVSRTVSLAILGLAIQKQVLPGIDTEEVLTVLRDLKRGAMEPAGH
ncbi:TetR/AcrR family transcriptional regulator [Sphingomonas bacterium]|uniref:TetR/AcrR family transcriptional regulator n=1 Tax=Sphingomonas bacterium TaxID=1895847 RepID=UPI0015768C88|nr:TetR/AcrR family transcriptional regulator [Sphingomonas bacterium]